MSCCKIAVFCWRVTYRQSPRYHPGGFAYPEADVGEGHSED
jgi:hypothetical protein